MYVIPAKAGIQILSPGQAFQFGQDDEIGADLETRVEAASSPKVLQRQDAGATLL